MPCVKYLSEWVIYSEARTCFVRGEAIGHNDPPSPDLDTDLSTTFGRCMHVSANGGLKDGVVHFRGAMLGSTMHQYGR